MVEGVAPELLPPGSGLMAGFERRRIATSGAEINLAWAGTVRRCCCCMATR